MMDDYPRYLERLKNGDLVNPFLDHFRITVTSLGDGTATFQMPIQPGYLQGAGLMQGGIIVALADEALAHAMMTLLQSGEGLTTIELKTDFCSAKEGDLVAEARVFKKGRTIARGDCLVKDDHSRHIVRLSATFMILHGVGERSYSP